MPEAEEPDRSELSFSWSTVRGHLAPFEICRTDVRSFFRKQHTPNTTFTSELITSLVCLVVG
jgi:hypothetical protein